MERTIFKNSIFYWLLIGYLGVVLIWNGYTTAMGNLYGLIPLTVQMILIYLIFDKNKFAKVGIKIWSILLIIGPGLSILGGLLKSIAGENMDFNETFTNLIMLTIGITVFYFNNKTVEIVIMKND